MIYTGIGSRQTPQHILEVMTSIANQLAEKWTLRSGHASGADQAFEHGAWQWCIKNGIKDTDQTIRTKMEIYLPWAGFNGAGALTLNRKFVVPKFNKELHDVAKHFHPAWSKCTSSVKYLMMRNVLQIAGADMNTPTDMVICWTPNGERGGGTGHALRIAEYLNIPIFDLAIEDGTKLCKFVQEKEK